MSDQLSNFELHKQQLVTSLNSVAESMRNCAQLAETFAKLIADSDISLETSSKRILAHSPDTGEGKKRKRNTKPKDPNAPKRPASSYILFQNEVRKELKEKHPDLSNSDLLSLISEQWKHMTDEQKETYNQAMKTAKAHYTEEKKAYDNRTPAEIEAANAATEEAKRMKKANARPRGPKPKDASANSVAAASSSPVIVTARPPPRLEEASPDTSDSSEEEESADDEPRHAVAQSSHRHSHHDSQSSDEEDEIDEPVKKKHRSNSSQPIPLQKARRTGSHI